MAHDYIETLRHVAAFAGCSRHDLTAIARLVDVVDLPAGTVISSTRAEVVVAAAPVRAVVIDRRAFDTVRDLAPRLAG